MRLDSTHPFLTPFIRRTLALIKPMDAVGIPLVHKGHKGDGGYVMLDELSNITAAYSLGIGGDVSWDLEMAEHGIDVWQYDHTVVAPPQMHPRFHFSRYGIAAAPSEDEIFHTLESLIARNGHAGQRDMILKIDIEGAEWNVFSGLRAETLEQFSQILVEFHELRQLNDNEIIWRILHTLSHLSATHQSIHLHANNNGCMATIGGITIPDVVEVTYARRSDHAFAPCFRIFPTGLDYPNDPQKADIFLGAPGIL
jgi:hypothetical protein